MFKKLRRSLFIAILCGSLTSMNTVAFAEENAAATSESVDSTASAAPSTPSTPSTQTKAESTGLVRNADGSISKKEKYKFDGSDNPNMWASIAMLGIGLIGTRMALKYRPITTDVMIAGVGAVAFVAGEIMSNIGFKKKLEDMEMEITKRNDGKADNNQIQRLQDLRKSYEEAKKTTETKKMLQMGAAIAFGIAGGWATYLAFTEDTLDATCNASIKAAMTEATTCPTAKALASGLPGTAAAMAAEEALCKECLGELTTYDSIFTSKVTLEKIPGVSIVKDAENKPKEITLKKPMCAAATEAVKTSVQANTSCQAALNNKFVNHTKAGIGGSSSNNFKQILDKILYGGQRQLAFSELNQSRKNSVMENTLNWFFPSAQASWIPFLGLGAGIAAAVAASSIALGSELDVMMYVPRNRAIAFFALAGLCYAAVKASEDEINKMQKNIDLIDKILAELGALSKGIAQQNVNDQQLSLAGFKANQDAVMEFNSNLKNKSDCILTSGNTNCPSVAAEIKKMPGFANLPDSFQSIASQAASMGDGLQGTNGISSSTLAQAQALGAKNNAIMKLLQKTQKMYNDKSPKKIDFAKEQSAFVDKLNAAAVKSIKSKGYTPAGFLSAVGGSPLNLSGDSSDSVKKASSVVKAKTASSGGAGANGAGDKKDKDELKLDFKEEKAVGDMGVAGATGDHMKAEYDIGTNDINTDSGASIFQLISDRYLKSGYPKLLEEEKVVVPLKK